MDDRSKRDCAGESQQQLSDRPFLNSERKILKLTVTTFWSCFSDGCLTARQAGSLTVCLNVTLTPACEIVTIDDMHY
jgi:hypothetical protein